MTWLLVQISLRTTLAKGHVDVLKVFLADNRMDANFMMDEVQGITLFMQACIYGHRAVVQALLADERVEVNRQDVKVNSRIEYGYYSHSCTHQGRTAFMCVSFNNCHGAVVTLLLADERVNVNMQDNVSHPQSFHMLIDEISCRLG